jgi:hypothetical protein
VTAEVPRDIVQERDLLMVPPIGLIKSANHRISQHLIGLEDGPSQPKKFLVANLRSIEAVVHFPFEAIAPCVDAIELRGDAIEIGVVAANLRREMVDLCAQFGQLATDLFHRHRTAV